LGDSAFAIDFVPAENIQLAAVSICEDGQRIKGGPEGNSIEA
jgi:hypothetical protein